MLKYLCSRVYMHRAILGLIPKTSIARGVYHAESALQHGIPAPRLLILRRYNPNGSL